MWVPMAGGVGRQQGRVLSTRDPRGGLIRDGRGWRGRGETGQGPRPGWGPWEGEHPSPGHEGASWGLAPTWAETGSRGAGGQRVPCLGCGTDGHRRSSEARAGGLPGRGTLAGERSEDRHWGSNLSKAAPFLGGHN